MWFGEIELDALRTHALSLALSQIIPALSGHITPTIECDSHLGNAKMARVSSLQFIRRVDVQSTKN